VYSIALSAGEASGDMFGGALVDEMKRLRGDLVFWGAGGPRMREAGVKITADMTGGGTIGISETLKSLPGVCIRYFRLRGELLRSRPDVFVPIDFGAFNIRLGQIANANGIRVVYYLPPSSWRRRPGNADKLIACGGRVITQFPWSADALCKQGVDARFVGHPLVDIVKPTRDRGAFLSELGLAESAPTIGLLPGSRIHEISEHLDMMIGCARIIHEELGGAQFVIGAANRGPMMAKRIERMASEIPSLPPIRVVEGRTYDCMAHSDFLITKSGTATLEAAILGTPMVIVYRGTPVMRFEFLFRKAILEDFIGLPNIIARRGVCPEFINDDAVAAKVADVALGIMRSDALMDKMKSELKGVRDALGERGAVGRAAEMILDMGGLV